MFILDAWMWFVFSTAFPLAIEYQRRPDIVRTYFSDFEMVHWLNKQKLKKLCVYFLKIHCKYWITPLLSLRIFYILCNHIIRSNDAVYDHFNFGYIAQIAIRRRYNGLLKIYLALGLNPAFRDQEATTLFEYAYWYKNVEVATWLVRYEKVVVSACVPYVYDRKLLYDDHSQQFVVDGKLENAQERLEMFDYIISPLVYLIHRFLKKKILKNQIRLEDGKLSLKNVLRKIQDKMYEDLPECAFSDYFKPNITIEELDKNLVTIRYKVFEKLCKEEFFTENDITFLKNECGVAMQNIDKDNKRAEEEVGRFDLSDEKCVERLNVLLGNIKNTNVIM